MLNRQKDFLGQKDWRRLYDTFSPRQHAVCPYDKFAAAINGSAQSRPNFDVSRFSIEQLKVHVIGDQGLVTYVAKFDGRIIDTATDGNPDVYVRIDGKWYDEIDSHSPFNC